LRGDVNVSSTILVSSLGVDYGDFNNYCCGGGVSNFTTFASSLILIG